MREPGYSRYTPDGRRYLAMACIDRGAALVVEPVGWIDIALRPRTESDVQETALWLNNLLHRIYGQVR